LAMALVGAASLPDLNREVEWPAPAGLAQKPVTHRPLKLN
jgi:hypothetical protein